MNGSLRQNVIFHSPASCWQVPALSHPLQLKPSKLTPSTSSAARLSLCALLSHHIYVYFFRFHLLLDLLQWAVRWDALWRKKAGRFQRELHAAEGEQRLHTRLQLLMIWAENKARRAELLLSCCAPNPISSQHLTNEAWFWSYSIIKQEQHFRSNLFRIKATLSPEYVFNVYIFDLWGSEI